MSSDKVAAGRKRAVESSPRNAFTVADANRSLVLVGRVVQNVVDRYAELMRLRTRREDLAALPNTEQPVAVVQRQIEAAVDELTRLNDELTAIGCILKDWATGLVDFPAVNGGRRVWLCWRLGEEQVTHWHELEAGFTGRQPIGPDFR